MVGAMMIRHIALALAMALFASGAHAQDGAGQRPIVVELFTSQGCISCPRANRVLGSLMREDDVLALTYGVPYWDYLGWRDTFARPEHTTRQRAYARSLHLRGPYTPQFVINGVRQVSATRLEAARTAIGELRALGPAAGAPHITLSRERNVGVVARISAGAAPPLPADIWFIEYDPGPYSVHVRSGDNYGQEIMHYNVVRRISKNGAWTGAPMQASERRCRPHCAVLVQAADGGVILAAATTRGL